MAVLIILGIIAFVVYSLNSNSNKATPPKLTGPAKFTLRLKEASLGDATRKVTAYEIQAMGPFPVKQPVVAKMVISVLDATDSNSLMPVFSSIGDFQELETSAYQDSTQLGTLRPDYGLVDWVRVGVVIPEILTTAYSGQRKLQVYARVTDEMRSPKIELGYCEHNAPGLLFTEVLTFTHQTKEVGYIEKQERVDQATVLTVKLAMAVAMADGSLADAEGEKIKVWVRKRIDSLTDDERAAELKAKVNQAIRFCYENSAATAAAMGLIADELRALNLKSHCYEAVELCFDVLAADGVAERAELDTVEEIARRLAIDTEELKRMRDQRIVRVDTSALAQDDPEKLLGMEPGWPVERKQSHLRKEFQKWNSRLNQLPEGQERDNAQRMLDRIAKARMALK